MYAYVRYLSDGTKDIVPTKAIKNFDPNKYKEKPVDLNKKYKIEWNNMLYEGTIIYLSDTEKQLEQLIENKRPRIPPVNLAKTTDDESSEDFNRPKVHVKDATCHVLLEKKKTTLLEKQSIDGFKTKNTKKTPKINDTADESNNTEVSVNIDGREFSNKSRCLEVRKERVEEIARKPPKKTIGAEESNNNRVSLNIDDSAEFSNRKLCLEVRNERNEDIAKKHPKKNVSAEESNNNRVSLNIDGNLECSNKKRCLEGKTERVEAIEGCDENCKKKLKLLKDKYVLLKEQNRDFARENQENQQIIRELTTLNMNLQKEVLNEFDELKHLVINNKDDNTAVRKDIPTGFRRKNSNTICLGCDVWLPVPIYESIKIQSKSAATFVKNTAVAIFGIDVLKTSTVTGKTSNRKKTAAARPRLDPAKILAIKSILRYWLTNDKKLDEAAVDYETTLVTTHISKKIAEYNRSPKKAPVHSYKKSGTQTTLTDDGRDESDNDAVGAFNNGEETEDFEGYGEISDDGSGMDTD